MGLERTDAQAGTRGMSFTEFIQGMAMQAKLNVQVKGPDMVVVPWDLENGRKQNTFVRPLGQTGAGHNIVACFSPALKMPADQQLGVKTANELLRKNAALPHGAWAIVRVDNDDYLGVQETLIASTLDAPEFYAACIATARLADEMERQMGADTF